MNVFNIFLYLGSVSEKKTRERVLSGLLRGYIELFCVFLSCFLRDHAIELLNET